MPHIVDWNNDGLPDLEVGLSNNGYDATGGDVPGLLYLYLNVGTKEQYKFHYAGVICTAKGDTISSPASPSAYTMSALGDINNDGLFDIVLSDTTGGMHFKAYLNVGTPGNPSFADPVPILAADGSVLHPDPTMHRFSIADWNGDSVNDLITDAGTAQNMTKVWVYAANSPHNEISHSVNTVNNSLTIGLLDRHSISISVPTAGEYSVSLFSLDGRLLTSAKANLKQGSSRMMLCNVPEGCYVARVRCGSSGAVVSCSVIRQK